jgi:hypothetical protein
MVDPVLAWTYGYSYSFKVEEVIESEDRLA